MKNKVIVIFIGLFLMFGCGQTGPLLLPEKLPDIKSSPQQEVKPEENNLKPKKSS
jgi:predicted small lipoprotein YifL